MPNCTKKLRSLRYVVNMFVYLSIKDAHDRQYNYMKITIFILIRMIRLIGFNIQDIQIHVNIQFCNQ